MVKRRITALAVAIACALLMLPGAAFAGNGSGSGGGGGQATPTLVASMPENGTEVSPASTEEMWVQFSNNVAVYPVVMPDGNLAVAGGNIEKVSLTRSDGTPVDVDVFVADTQTEPDKRTYLYISPADQLEPGAYVITVKAGITAKNGNSSATDETISFTVADAAGNSASSADAAAAPASSASAAASASPASSAAASSGAGEESSHQGAVPVAAVVVVVIVAAVCIAAALRFRKKKNDSRASDDTAEDATPKDTKSE